MVRYGNYVAEIELRYLMGLATNCIQRNDQR
jgi:hypothetical protein